MVPFTALKVWQRSHASALAVYRVTKRFPPDERFGVTSQLRRAAVSIGTNIAEDSKRQHAQDLVRFLNIAQASVAEAESLLLLSKDLGYVSVDDAKPVLFELDGIARMLTALRRKVESGAVG